MNLTAFSRAFLIPALLVFSFVSRAQSTCASAAVLSTACSTTGSLQNAATAAPAGNCGGATASTTYGEWYRFTATSTSATITVSGLGQNLSASTTFVEVLNGSCGSQTVRACQDVSSPMTVTSLVIGTVYYARVYVTSNPTTNRRGYTITLEQAPANDACASSQLLTTASSCSNTSATLSGATASSPAVSSGCAGTPGGDVWFRFVAQSGFPTISLSSIGSSFSTAGVRLQLYSGSCGSFTSLACASGTSSTLSMNAYTATGGPLSIGTTYFLRVYSPTTAPSGCNWGFNICVTENVPTNVQSGRSNEVFRQTILSDANVLNDPWEVTYGSDGYLWVTEAKGYKVQRIDPVTSARTTVLDISQGSTFLPAADQGFNVQFSSSQNPWPQGGMMGLALHPDFAAASNPKPYVYIGYVHTFIGSLTNNAGVIFTNRLVRFTYNSSTGKLQDPVSLCDTLPGSNDHNSGRLIVAPVDGVDYLFYASGDMGSGQFGNANRPIKSQINASYEGKILRFRLEPDLTKTGLDQWIPASNPFNLGASLSAVWSTGIRNNQGFAKATINGVNLLYGSSHGPYSDDELNIIEGGKNYGHPEVVGYSADGNYNGSKAGSATGTCPLITSEAANAAAIGINYRDPIFSAYAVPAGNSTTPGTVNYIYVNQPGNGGWPSEGWSGMEIYTDSKIPGWKNSMVLASLKWGRLVRLKLNSAGTAVIPENGQDTLTYFGSTNRFRDVAFGPNGKDIYVVMDKSSTTSGPTANNPIVPACAGCLQKYTFIGYNTGSSGRSAIPTTVSVATGTVNNCVAGTDVTINAANGNTNIWVPITDSEGAVVAEINANGQELGNITTSLFVRTGALREDAQRRLYLNRNITIIPQNQPSSAVGIRLYLTASELSQIIGSSNSTGRSSGVASINDLRIMKNGDVCGSPFTTTASFLTPAFADTHGSAYVLQASISSFSTFYFTGQGMLVLPQELLTFKGSSQNGNAVLRWETANEQSTSHFEVERSIDATVFVRVGSVAASGTTTRITAYGYTDRDIDQLGVPVVYYRLRMVDQNGAFKYSPVVSVNTNTLLYTFNAYPNPVQDELRLKLGMGRAASLLIQVVDMQGKVIYSHSRYAGSGTNELRIDTRRWSSQTYTIRVLDTENRVIASRTVVKI